MKEIRKEKGISRNTMAEKLEVSVNTIAAYEQGVNEPNIEKLIKISIILGTTVDRLVGKEEKKKIVVT